MSAAPKVVELHPIDPTAELKVERLRVVTQLAEIDRKRSRLAEAEQAERDAFAAIGALGERELEAVKTWVASGCEGEQPKPDAEERRVLSDRLANATRTAELARSAAVDLDTEAKSLRARLAGIDGEIRAAHIARLLDRHADLLADCGRHASVLRGALASIEALPVAMIEAGRRAFDVGDEQTARAFYATAEKMRARELTAIEPSPAEVTAAVAEWAQRIRETGA